jgi:hypothetical protein
MEKIGQQSSSEESESREHSDSNESLSDSSSSSDGEQEIIKLKELLIKEDFLNFKAFQRLIELYRKQANLEELR